MRERLGQLPPMALLLGGVCLALVACGEGSSAGPAADARVTVGLRSELRLGVDVSALRATLQAGTSPAEELLLTPDTGLHFPMELDLGAHPGGESLTLTLEAMSPFDPVRPLLSRRVELEAPAGRHVLVPLRLEVRCVQAFPGSPTCDATETCVGGTCSDPHVEVSELEEYASGWESADVDRCKPLDAGAPVVVVGQGQVDFHRLDPTDPIPLEAGPQGGHHVWIALRTRNLRQAGSVTTVRGRFPSLGLEVPDYRVIFSLRPSEGGACDLPGLRFQVDAGNVDVQSLLGQRLEVEVEVRDPSGSVGVGTASVHVADHILD